MKRLATMLLTLGVAASLPAQQGARPSLGDTVTTASGLKYVFTKLGTGGKPQPGDVMVIHGIGSLTNGKEFWNTRTEGAPYEYTPDVDRVIKGFSEGMREVREGDRVVITMSPELGYGARGSGANIPPNSTLVFDYEVLAIHPLSVARLLRDTTVAGGLDSSIARIKRLPNLKEYYVSPSSIQSVAGAANRRHAGDGEKVLEFGLTLMPNSDAMRTALTTFRTNAARRAAPPGTVAIRIETQFGAIDAYVDSVHAPITAANFLKYVDAKSYDSATFFRAVTLENQPTDSIRIQVIQVEKARGKPGFPAIPLERTSVTGIQHVNGTLSMARYGPDTGTDSFSIVIGDQPEMNFGGKRNKDGQGFAAFGKVTNGWDVIRRIQTSPAKGQTLITPVVILRIVRQQ